MNSMSTNRSWGKLALAVLAALLLAVAAQAEGKGNGVEVRALSPTLEDAQAGQILSLSFSVTNHTQVSQELLESLRLPPDWQPLLPSTSFILPPGASTVRIAAVRIPSGVPAGRYQINYGVRGQRDYAVQDSDSVDVVVAAVSKLALWLESRPEPVIAGKSFDTQVRVINQGNSSLKVTLTARADDQVKLVLKSSSVTVAAGSSELVTLTGQTSANEHRTRQVVIGLRAEATDPSGKPMNAALTIVVDLIPRVTLHRETGPVVASTLSLQLVGGRDGSAPQFQWAGGGPLDDSGQRRVDFSLRGPDTQNNSVYGLQSEYWINYSAKDLNLHLGDQPYGLSPLTSYFRYGRGLGLDFHPVGARGMEGGVYFVQSRWGDADPETGAYVGQRCGDNLDLRLNLVTRHEQPSSVFLTGQDTVWSVQANAHPRNLNLSLEYGFGNANPVGGTVHDQAYRLEAQGHAGRGVDYSVEAIHAGPNYPGYYQGMNYDNGTVTFPLGARLQALVSFRDWRENLDLDPVRGSAPHERLMDVGLRWPLRSGWQLSLDGEDYLREDRLTPAQFNYREHPLIVAVDHATGASSFRLETRTGQREDLLTGEDRLCTDLYFFGFWRPSNMWTMTLYGATGPPDDFSTSYLLGARNNLGATVAWQSPDGFSAGVNYLNYGFAEQQSTSQWEVYAGKVTPDERALQFRLRQIRPSGMACETDYVLSYSLPLDLEVGHRRDSGLLSGRVFAEGAAPGHGLADVILTAGDATAVTNSQGEFIFPTLAPGPYRLEVAGGSLGISQVTRDKLPLLIEVKAGETTRVDLPVLACARLSGEIRVVPPPEDKAATPGAGASVAPAAGPVLVGDPLAASIASGPQPLPNVLVEVTAGDEVWRVMSDSHGRFSFEGLRPGTWQLKVYSDNLPALHRWDQQQVEVTLKSGETQQVEFQALPVERHMQLIDGGTLQSSAPSATPPG